MFENEIKTKNIDNFRIQINEYFQRCGKSKFSELEEEQQEVIGEIFQDCVRNNFKEGANFLLGKGISVNWAKKDNGHQVLFDIIRAGNKEMFYWLLEHKVDINTPNLEGRTPLAEAAILYSGTNRFFVKNLLDKGANANTTFSYRDGFLNNPYKDMPHTPLTLASRKGDLDFATLLLNEGKADPNFEGGLGAPLVIASYFNEFKVASLLLDKGADTEKRFSIDKSTPLILSAKFGNEQIVNTLLERNANITAVDKDLKTALHWAAEGIDFCLTKNGNHFKVIILLLKKAAEDKEILKKLINMQDKDEKTALDLVKGAKHQHVVRLLEKVLDLLRQDKYEEISKLLSILSIQEKDEDIVKTLEGNLKEESYEKSTSQSSTEEQSNFSSETSETIRESNNKETDFEEEIIVAIENIDVKNFTNSVNKYFEKYGKKLEENEEQETIKKILKNCVQNNFKEGVEFLLEKGVNVNIIFSYDNLLHTPLTLALRKRNVRIVELLLIEGKADPNFEGTSEPALVTALYFCYEVTYLLLQHNADVEKPFTFNNATPLIISAMFGYDVIAKKLLENNAIITAVDQSLRTALHWSACGMYFKISDRPVENGNHLKIVMMLLQKAAEKEETFKEFITMKDEDGNTALDLAKKTYYQHVITQLKKYPNESTTELLEKFSNLSEKEKEENIKRLFAMSGKSEKDINLYLENRQNNQNVVIKLLEKVSDLSKQEEHEEITELLSILLIQEKNDDIIRVLEKGVTEDRKKFKEYNENLQKKIESTTSDTISNTEDSCSIYKNQADQYSSTQKTGFFIAGTIALATIIPVIIIAFMKPDIIKNNATATALTILAGFALAIIIGITCCYCQKAKNQKKPVQDKSPGTLTDDLITFQVNFEQTAYNKDL